MQDKFKKIEGKTDKNINGKRSKKKDNPIYFYFCKGKRSLALT